MKIAVLGMGGVGGYIGGRLAQAAAQENTQVIFIARGTHLEKIRESGIRVIDGDREFTAVPYLATDDPQLVGTVDVLLCCVKSYDLESAASQYRGIAGPDTIVIPLMNGIQNAEILETHFPDSLVGQGCIYIFSHVASPGVIKKESNLCKVIMGKDQEALSKLEPLQKIMEGSGISTYLEPDPMPQVWTKFLLISPLACVTSLYGETIGKIMEEPTKYALLRGLMMEAFETAVKSGIRLSEEIVEKALDAIEQMPYDGMTSMHRDFELGRKTELDSLCKSIIDLGEKLGVSTPKYKNIYAILKKWA